MTPEDRSNLRAEVEAAVDLPLTLIRERLAALEEEVFPKPPGGRKPGGGGGGRGGGGPKPGGPDSGGNVPDRLDRLARELDALRTDDDRRFRGVDQKIKRLIEIVAELREVLAAQQSPKAAKKRAQIGMTDSAPLFLEEGETEMEG